MPRALSAVLVELADAISGTDTLDGIYAAALRGIVSTTGIPRASILLFDDDGVMRFKAWQGLSAEYRATVEGHSPWRPGDPPADPIVTPDVRADPELAPYADAFTRESIRALAFIPIVTGRRIIGKFMLYGDTPYAFDQGELPHALAIGYQIGLAVERARRDAEKRLAHQRMVFALDAAQMGTWQWDITANTVTWSDNLERIHGLPPGTFTGAFESYAREIHPDDRDRVMQSLRRALTEDAIHDVEYRIVAPDGTVRWVQGKGRVERNAAGNPVLMSGVCMDVSSRKQADLTIARALQEEAAVRTRLTELTSRAQRLLMSVDPASAREAVLELATGVIPADAYAIWQLQADGWRMTASRGLSDAFTGIVLPRAPHLAFRDAIVADDVHVSDMLDARRDQYVAEGVVSLLSIPLLLRDEPMGSVVFYHRSRHHTTDLELKVALALGHLAAAAITNATLYEEQQRLRHEAQDAEVRAAFLAKASGVLSSLDYQANLHRVAELAVPDLSDWCAVDLLTPAGTIERIAVTHKDPEQVALARQVHERYPSGLDDSALGTVIRTGLPQLHTEITDELIEASAKDAEHARILRALEIRSAMIVPLTAGRTTFGAISFVSQAGGRMFTQTDLDFAVELGRRAALAIENARLFEEAREANRLKDEFLATLSHELRTPLNVVMGRARRLRDAGLPAATVQQVGETIERNAGALARLVEDLLDVSRFTLGQINLQLQPTEWAQVVQSVVHSLEPTARAKGVDLDADVLTDLPAVAGDATRLQQVTWNLIMNAIKFTPPGGRITVALTRDGDELQLTVSDTGVGISPDFLPSVFDLFRQEDPTTRHQGGLGLGLSIVKRLVELHGGRVHADSPGRDRGATFAVRLPCARELAASSGDTLKQTVA